MSTYDEGLYQNADGEVQVAGNRTLAQLKMADLEIRDERGRPLIPCPTPETKGPAPASVNALSKFDQEQLCLIVSRTYRIPTVALRFFNTSGPNQALSNSYTGLLNNFASPVLNGNRPLIPGDGLCGVRLRIEIADIRNRKALCSAVNLLEEIRRCDNPPPLLFTSTAQVYGGLSDLSLELNGVRYRPLDAALRTGGNEDRPLDFHSPNVCSNGAANHTRSTTRERMGCPPRCFA